MGASADGGEAAEKGIRRCLGTVFSFALLAIVISLLLR
jgi:hypothetical protein